MINIAGNMGGIIFRSNRTYSDFYYFLVGQDGSYKFGLMQSNQLQPDLKSSNSSFINKGPHQVNLIAVVADGSQFALYVNSHHIASVTDNTLTSGQIGVMAYDIAGNITEVAFNNAKVWTM